MSGGKVTQEERVLLAIFKSGTSCTASVLKKRLGMTDRSFTHTLHLLERGNCIKTEGETILITPHGTSICRTLKP